MNGNCERIIFHIDVNSAFLSWSAVATLEKGEEVDFREIPSIVGGDEESRRGVVLAKSNSAKAFGIVTGESIFSARRKCPNLKVVSPNFSVYEKYSKAMMELLSGYTPLLQQYSIDECFLDVTSDLKGEPLQMASDIKDRIKEELGFTVNIGISSNKILAKMASEFRKPNAVNTLYLSEIKERLWPLPVSELFMVGRSATEKLNKMYIYTIGDLANYSLDLLKLKFKSHGQMMWEYANGIDDSKVEANSSEMKGISRSTTLAEDIKETTEAKRVLRILAENLAARLRETKRYCYSISVTIKSSDFKVYSHQKRLSNPTDSTSKIVETAESLFQEVWKNEAIRLLGVSLTQLVEEGNYQMSMFDDINQDKARNLDKAIDMIKNKYGGDAVKRAGTIK